MQDAGDRAAANLVAPFEDERVQAAARQVVGRGEAVVPAADDDRLRGALGAEALAKAAHARASARILLAALRPGAPMMPPPGCVAEPHM
jgi:hypothetical protein